MAKTRFAKFKRASHPAIRDMLTRERARALEKALALIDARLPASHGELKLRLQRKRRQVDRLLSQARKVSPL
jgi:hypothetical protein